MTRYILFAAVILILVQQALASEQPLKLIESGTDSLLFEFELADIRFEKREVNGRTYDVISLMPDHNVTFTPETGKPQMPIHIELVGIPLDASPEAIVIHSEFEMKGKYKLFPTQPPSLHSDKERFFIDERFYGKNLFYPPQLAEIEPLGYIRQQRVASLKIMPIQYNPSTGQLRVYKRLQIRVKFPIPKISGAPAKQPYTIHEDSPYFEGLLSNTLVNYQQAKRWRKNGTNPAFLAPNLSAGWGGAPSLAGESGPSTYKLMVDRTGLYKITQPELIAWGVDVVSIDPKTFKLYSEGDEVQTYVHGEADGKFDETDYIVFYGKKIDNSKFTNSNVYWLSWGGQDGVRTITKDGTPKTVEATIPIAFKKVEHYERDRAHDTLVNVKSEMVDHYFWAGFTGEYPKNKEKYFQILLPHLAKGLSEGAVLRVRFQGITYRRNELHKALVYMNGHYVLKSEFNGQAAPVAENRFSQQTLNFENWMRVECEDKNLTPETGRDFMLDWYELEYWRIFEAEDGRLEFSSETSPGVSGPVRYVLSGFSKPDISLYQITNAQLIARIENFEVTEIENLEAIEEDDVIEKDKEYQLVVEDDVAQPTQYYAIQTGAYLKVKQAKAEKPSNLRNPAHKVDYIVISHEIFLDEIRPLAEYRERQGFNVLIVDVEDIYDEFSNGVFNPMAIKSFLRYAYHYWDKAPSYVLLVGDAHYDYKNTIVEYYKSVYGAGYEYNLYPIFVPTYHGWSPEGGETAMDHRFVTVSGDDTLPDIAIGRLSVQRPLELKEIVAKIIAYEESPTPGPWRARIVQVADNEVDHVGDQEFEKTREELFKYYIPVSYEGQKIYLRKIQSPYKTRRMITDAINNGAVLLEYAGHGGSWSWADEYIFGNEHVYWLRNKGKYPFIIATTCLNGFFDKPQRYGDRSLGEEFLLGDDKGAIAVLSATRLTYATANSKFDKDIFTRMFKTKPAHLGLIIMQSKIDFIKKHKGSALYIPGAEQYTLFGDPATTIALPQFEIITELEEHSLDTGKKLVVKRNIIGEYQHGKLIKADDFSTDMSVRITYPNDLDDNVHNDIGVQEESIPIWQGKFGDIRIDIPPGVISGEGIVRLYAESDGISAVGGSRFAMYLPVISEFRHELTDTSLLVYAKVTDNTGPAGLEDVSCLWYDTVYLARKETKMIKSEGEWYKTQEPIPLPRGGQFIKYTVIAKDVEGNRVGTEEISIEAPVGANLAVSVDATSRAPQIFYGFSREHKEWTLSAKLENNGGKSVGKEIAVYFFDGSPDTNGDAIIDEGAQILGYAKIPPGDWQKGEEIFQMVDVVIDLQIPLSSGLHNIFVWVDPEMPSLDHSDKVIGKLDEHNEFDNKLSQFFPITDFKLTDKDLRAYSLNRIMDIFIPSGAAEPTTVSITSIKVEKQGQPGILPAPLPIFSANDAYKIEFHSGIESLSIPARLQLKFDVQKLKEKVKHELRLDQVANLSEEQTKLLEDETRDFAEKLSIYSWNGEFWKRTISRVVTEADGSFSLQNYVSPSTARNANSQSLTIYNIQIDQTLTPTGQWVILFLDDTRYEIHLRKDGEDSPEKLGRTGNVGVSFRDESVGLKVNIPIKTDTAGERLNFEYGDVFTFVTFANTAGDVEVGNIRNSNYGTGAALIDILPADETIDFEVGNWLIFFTNPNTYELRDGKNQPVYHAYSEAVIGFVNKELLLPHLGISISVNAGDKPFQFGDKIKFSTAKAGIVETQIEQLSTFALMENNDTKPPRISLWTDGNMPQSGTVIPPRPEISILIEDINGVDMDTFKLEVSKDDGPFYTVTPKEYVIGKQVFSVPVRYKPILYIGKYAYHISVLDVNGNPAKLGSDEYVEFIFYVEEQPDLTPPDIQIEANGEPLFDEDVLDEQPTFKITITDEHGINPNSVVLMFSRVPDELEQVRRGYKFGFNPTYPTKATIDYALDLPNGDYSIQLEVEDTSKNKSYLSETAPLTFTINEPVNIERIVNAPNPFEEDTVFTYVFSQEPEDVTIKIYTPSGRLIKTIQNASAHRNYNEQYWDGRDEDGKRLANGIYLYKIIVKIIAETKEKKIEKYKKLGILR